MDPLSIVAGSFAVVFALLAMLQWRRASELEETVRQLEAKLAARLPPPEEPPAAPAPEPTQEAPDEDEPPAEEEPDEDDEDEAPEADEAPADDEGDEPEAEPEDDEPEDDEPEDDEPEADEPEADEPADDAPDEEPAAAEAEPAPEPPAPEPPDNRRQIALQVVTEAFETCRYLDFDAIVEKPSTYRVTVPITAANADGVRMLEPGMFACLKHVAIESDRAVLHIDSSKGRP